MYMYVTDGAQCKAEGYLAKPSSSRCRGVLFWLLSAACSYVRRTSSISWSISSLVAGLPGKQR
jgi:hypothetical protein